MQAAAAEGWKYGDPELHDLKAALAAHHGVTPANVAVGEGIDGLLGNLVRLLVAPGTPVVTSAGAYPTFDYHVAGFGGQLVTVPYRDDAEDPEALLLAARKAGAPLLYLANPDNPMGSWHAGARIGEMIARLPGGCRALPRRGLRRLRTRRRHAAARPARAARDPHAHLLQGARHGRRAHRLRPRPPRADRRLRPGPQPFRRRTASPTPGRSPRSPTAPGSRRWSPRSRPAAARLAAIAAANGLTALPSATNFVAIDCGRDGAYARRVLDALTARGIFVRMPFVAPQDRCIRVTVGRPADLDAFAAALPEALAAAG